ncbi:MAG: hypothetical protein KAR20_13830, partial [Candidatus Heimdallarchaeota archaeon]|nr:hypothetical protein [Candidatus Heimdallarchaeota archaeon]
MKNHIKKPLLKDVYKSQRTIEEATEKSKLKLNPSLDDIHNIRKSSEKKKPFFELGYYLATTQGQQPLSIVEIKKMFGGNEKYYREFLPFFCDVIKPKWVG